MTVDLSGITAVQSRMAEIQSRLGMPATSTNTTAAAAGSNTTFDRSMREALATIQGPATAARPFVYDPTAGPTAVTAKAGAAAALAAPPAPSTGATSGTAATSGTSATSATSATAPVSGVTGVAGATSGATVDKLIAAAKKYLGVPYKWGGTNPATGGLDCSGFTQRAYKDIGISIPRVSQDQQDVGRKVASLADAKPGDLIFYGNPAHHVTMYLGNNKMIAAPRTGDVVKIQNVYGTPTSISRILPDSAFTDGTPELTRGDGPLERSATTSAASLQAASTAAATAMLRGASASPTVSNASLGGWAGAPLAADDTWGAASANAAALGVSGLVGGSTATPAVAPIASSGGLAAVAPTGSSAAVSGVLAQAPAALRELFVSAGRKYGVPADLLAAVAKQESDFTPTAVSHAGARGLMQLMPGTARGLGVTNAFDPAQAVDGAARLLRDHLRTFGSTELALAAYNAGPGAVRRYDGIPPYSETQNYVRKIMTNLRAGTV